MKQFSEIIQRLKRGPSDVCGIDFGATGTKVVRMSRTSGEPTVLGADCLPVAPLVEEPGQPESAGAGTALPPALKSRYAALTLTSREAIIKLLSFPGRFEPEDDGRILQSLGLKHSDAYRVSYRVLVEGTAKTESRILAVAVPENQARALAGRFATGLPAPNSIELSGLAALSAFLHSPLGRSDEPTGVLDVGGSVTSFGLFSQGQLGLFRRFDLGMADILGRIAQSLGVDDATALGVLADRSFDVSRTISTVMEPLIKQLIVSRDFLERRENCRIHKIVISGGLAVSEDTRRELRSALDLEPVVLNPFEGLACGAGVLSKDAQARPWRYTAAVGACLATLEGA
jgi:Tfp pilus assembly PilM family ATPase